MEGAIRIAAIVLFAATAGEGAIEFVISPIFDWLSISVKPRVVLFNIISAGLGVFLANNFHIGVFAFLGAEMENVMVDFVITGILIGRGSNYIHGIIKQFILKE